MVFKKPKIIVLLMKQSKINRHRSPPLNLLRWDSPNLSLPNVQFITVVSPWRKVNLEKNSHISKTRPELPGTQVPRPHPAPPARLHPSVNSLLLIEQPRGCALARTFSTLASSGCPPRAGPLPPEGSPQPAGNLAPAFPASCSRRI